MTTSPFALWGAAAGTSNALLADWQLGTGYDLQTLWADPQLVNPAGFDLHIFPFSPCLAGSTVDFGSTTDIDGQPRQVSHDIGADEFSGATVIPVGTGCAGTAALVPECERDRCHSWATGSSHC
jgi:hypothetical protein